MRIVCLFNNRVFCIASSFCALERPPRSLFNPAPSAIQCSMSKRYNPFFCLSHDQTRFASQPSPTSPRLAPAGKPASMSPFTQSPGPRAGTARVSPIGDHSSGLRVPYLCLAMPPVPKKPGPFSRLLSSPSTSIPSALHSVLFILSSLFF